MDKLFFNASMPRAGSELLQAILHQNPRIYASSTSPLLEYQFAARSNFELPEVRSQDPERMGAAFVSMCRGMAHGYYDALTDRPVVCDKNRGWSHYYEWVDLWNPKPKIICMVRDLRSIIGSMERIYRNSRHRPVGPDDPARLHCMTLDQRVVHWLASQPVGQALQRTLDCFQRNIADSMLFVRYESLCSNPEEAVARIYEFIGEEPFNHDFQSLKKSVPEDGTHFGPYGDHTVRSRLLPSTDWKDILPPAVAEFVYASNPWYNDAFDY